MKELSERTKRILSKLVVKLAHDTECNMHTEVRFKIAQFFAFCDNESRIFLVLRNMYGDILREEELQDGISKEVYNLRYALDEQLFSCIKNIYGEDILAKVKESL